MRFAHPEQLLWLLAWLAMVLFLVQRNRARAAMAQAFARLPMLRRLLEGREPGRTALRLGLVLLGAALGVLALAGPRWGLRPERVESRGTDVMFAVDVSTSMGARDYSPDRMEAARRELRELARLLAGNPMGLVAFAGSAFPFSPLTTDSGATDLFLDNLDLGSVPIPGTAIGDALRTALERIPTGDTGGYIVLLTDGEDHHSQPLEAARACASRGVRVIALGIGTPEGEAVPEVDAEGRPAGELLDEEGKPVRSRLDEETLREVARITEGAYFRVQPGSDAAEGAAAAIRQGQTRALDSRDENRLRERFQVFLALGLGLVLAGRLIPEARS